MPEAWGRVGCWADAGRLQHSSAWCQVQSPTSLGTEMEKEQFPLQQHSGSFFPSSFLSLSEFTRQDDAFARNVHVCVPLPGETPANPPIPNCAELIARLARTLCLALGAAFAMRGFMTCYISTFNGGWVDARSFH